MINKMKNDLQMEKNCEVMSAHAPGSVDFDTTYNNNIYHAGLRMGLIHYHQCVVYARNFKIS